MAVLALLGAQHLRRPGEAPANARLPGGAGHNRARTPTALLPTAAAMAAARLVSPPRPPTRLRCIVLIGVGHQHLLPLLEHAAWDGALVAPLAIPPRRLGRRSRGHQHPGSRGARDAAAEGWRTRRMALLKSSSSSCCVLPRLNCGPSARFPALSIASRASTAPLTAWGSGRRGRGAARSVRGAAHHHRSAPA